MNSFYFEHWSQVPDHMWVWPNFSPSEIACKGTGSLLLVPELMYVLQDFRTSVGIPFSPTSAYRSPMHNARVGGAPMSRHKFGDAVDIPLIMPKQGQIEAMKDSGFLGIGASYNTFVHGDIWRKRTW